MQFVNESVGKMRELGCAPTASFSLCGYSLPHNSITQECQVGTVLCVSVVTARGADVLAVH